MKRRKITEKHLKKIIIDGINGLSGNASSKNIGISNVTVIKLLKKLRLNDKLSGKSFFYRIEPGVYSIMSETDHSFTNVSYCKKTSKLETPLTCLKCYEQHKYTDDWISCKKNNLSPINTQEGKEYLLSKLLSLLGTPLDVIILKKQKD